jgi:hypothetical protein
MLVVVPDWAMLPVPETTCPPTGAADASGEKASRIAVASTLRLNAGLPCALAALRLWRFLATVARLFCAVLLIGRLIAIFESVRFIHIYPFACFKFAQNILQLNQAYLNPKDIYIVQRYTKHMLPIPD